MVPIRSLIATLALCAALAGAAPCIAAEAGGHSSREHHLKAGYLFNFAKFVEWPTEVTEHMVICFRGAHEVHDSLHASSREKQIGTRKLIVRRLDETEAALGCSILYLEATAAAHARPETASVLTVSDSRGFARNGGMIELFQENNRLRFRINVANARRAGLRISSDLLQLATIVDREDAR